MVAPIQKNYKNIKAVIRAIILLSIPVILILLPADYFDKGESISIFALAGAEEYAFSTGMTRAVMHLIHLDFGAAAQYNYLSFVVLPLFVILWLKLLGNELGYKVFKKF